MTKRAEVYHGLSFAAGLLFLAPGTLSVFTRYCLPPFSAAGGCHIHEQSLPVLSVAHHSPCVCTLYSQ